MLREVSFALALAALVVMSFVSCGGGGTPRPSPEADMSIREPDVEAINALVSDVVMKLSVDSPAVLRPLVDAGVADKELVALVGCWPEGGGIEMAQDVIVLPGKNGMALAQFELGVTNVHVRGVEDTVSMEWSVRHLDGGTWLLAQAPECPFGAEPARVLD